ncbi:MAG TPA: sugar kinase [Microbacterium sp.]
MMLTLEGAVATYGEPLLRLTGSAATRLAQTAAFDVAVGGAELNVGVALASLGREVRVIAAVPDSPLGDQVIRAIRAAGASSEHVARVPRSRIGLYFVEKTAAPRGHRVVYDRRDTAFASSDPSPDALAGVGVLVVSGITAALGDAPLARLRALIADAVARGVGVVIDVNHRALLWGTDAASRTLAPLLRSADVVICASRDAAALFHAEGPALEQARLVRETLAPHSSLVVITDGDRGAAAVSDTGHWQVPAVPTSVVDRFGAGDAFTAGLLWGLTGGRSVPAALEAGVALAAMACTIEGDSATFDAAELEAVLADPAGVMVR